MDEIINKDQVEKWVGLFRRAVCYGGASVTEKNIQRRAEIEHELDDLEKEMNGPTMQAAVERYRRGQ